jgi:hypothetical protein
VSADGFPGSAANVPMPPVAEPARKVDARELLRRQLQQLGADGLCSAEYECGCGIDDLAPCDLCCLACRPARWTRATEDGETYEAGDIIYVPLKL